MKTPEELKNIVREKYSEIALQDKGQILAHVAVPLNLLKKYTTSWRMIMMN